MKERLGKETVKDFDACALGLTHAKVRIAARARVRTYFLLLSLIHI